VNPSKGLARVAKEREWPVAKFRPRARPGLEAVARTAAAYGGLAAAFGAGLGIGLLNRSRKDAVNVTISVGSDVALALAGIRLNVVGEEHLWSHRPAVFIFNHQSWLDGMVMMKLLRHDVTAVAKKEVSRQPVFGQFAWLMNMAFVDRSNTERARRAMEPVVDRINEGFSLAISPEGTRSATPRMAPFKKGAFHMAMQAGVPIVPIVIRNAGLHLWRGSMVMRPGTIDVAVLPPVLVDDWRREDLDRHVADVQALFQATLDDWPTAGRADAPVVPMRPRAEATT
jgi:putative phosphoserine phosphatase/1-acylglycerol-3-phosphate O-acyltransferase